MVGVIDADQDTGITADTPENGDEDYLRFYTAGNEIMTTNPSGKTGIGQLDPEISLDISNTDGIRIPVGTTAQRPSTTIGDVGIIRYNTELKII